MLIKYHIFRHDNENSFLSTGYILWVTIIFVNKPNKLLCYESQTKDNNSYWQQ